MSIPIDPRHWLIRLNETIVSFEELVNRLHGAGFRIGAPVKSADRDKTTEEVIAERFEGIDKRMNASEGMLLQRIEALEQLCMKQRDAWAQRFEDLEKKIEKNGISDCSLQGLNKFNDRVDGRLRILESYHNAVRDTIAWTKPECEKLTQQLTVIEGKQASTEMAAAKLEKRVSGLDEAFASHTVSQRAFAELQDHVDQVDKGHNERLKRLEVGVYPNAEQSLPRRFAEMFKRLQTLEAKEKAGWMPNPEPVRFNNEGTGVEIVVHDFPWHSERGPALHEFIDRIARLKPKRVIVDASGPGNFVLQEMRRHGLPAEPMNKLPRVVDGLQFGSQFAQIEQIEQLEKAARSKALDESMNLGKWADPKNKL